MGFQRAAGRYERARPEVPQAALDSLTQVLGITHRTSVLELGAGTGKLSRLLAPRAGPYLGVEPVPGMRDQFRASNGAIPLVGGIAEMLPLRAASFDSVVAAQAFHWFDVPRAMAEMHRVLRPGGTVGLVWSVRDESVDWVHQVTVILDQYDPGSPRFRKGNWREVWARTPGFEPLQRQSFPFVHRLDRQTTLARFTSVSFIASLTPERFAEAEGRLRHLLDTHPMTAGRSEIDAPYDCQVFSSRAVP